MGDMEAKAWKRLFRADPLPTRSHPRPRRRTSADASWADLRSFVALLRFDDNPAREAAASRLVAAVTDHQPSMMTGAGAALLYGDLILNRSRLWPMSDVQREQAATTFQVAVPGLAHWLLVTQGGRVLAEAVDRVRLARETKRASNDVWVWSTSFLLAARSVLTQAPPDDYEAAIAAFSAIAAREGWRSAAIFAFVLGDDRPESHALQPLPVLRCAVEAGAVVATEPDLVPLIVDAPPGAVAEWRHHRRGAISLERALVGSDRLAATLDAVARRNGEPALPALSWLFHHAGNESREAIAKAIVATRQDGALNPLLPFLHRSGIRAALARAETCDPAWMAGRYLVAVANGRGGPTLKARLQAFIVKHGAATVKSWAQDLGSSAVVCLDRLTQADAVALAPRETWPAAIREHPWRDPARRAFARTVLTIAPHPTPLMFDTDSGGPSSVPIDRGARALVLPSMATLPGLIVMIEASIGPASPWHLPATLKPVPSAGASEDTILSWLEARLAQLHEVSARSLSNPYDALYDGLERQPAALALRLWRRGGPLLALHRWRSSPAGPMLRRFGSAAVPAFVTLVADNPAVGFDEFGDVGAGELAPIAAHAVMRVRAARAGALAWLRRHRAVALMHLVPRAVGPAGPEREAAGVAIRRLWGDPGGAETLADIVARYSAEHPQIRAAIAEVLTFDENLLAPDRILPLPSWFIPSTLSRPELRSGGALGDDAIVAIGEVLSFSTPDNVHAGVDTVREACTASSLGRFASDVLAAWFAGGTPGQQVWALRTVGWFGDDASIPPLMAVLRRFLEAKVLPQAAIAIEALAEIGSDAALAQLSVLAQKGGFPSMRGKARRHLDAVAQARGLTCEELEDRTAPDLGLDDRGGLVLDFGTRRFRIELDDNLRPVVHDATSQARSDLPKPRRTDDAELAAAATARWRALKRELRVASGPAIRRLEIMLATGRRVLPEVFIASFAQHPFIQNLSRRLLWGVFDDLAPDAGPLSTFRQGKGDVFLDLDGARVPDVALKAPCRVGLVHPLQITSAILAAWRTDFARNGIIQPVPQIDRTVHRLSTAERANTALYRFQGLEVDAGWLRGMGVRGWPFKRPVEDGLMWAVEREIKLRDGRRGVASLAFADGPQVGSAQHSEAPRVLDVLRLQVPAESFDWSPVSFDQLDPVTTSELIHEIDKLAHNGRHPPYADTEPLSGRAVTLQ